MLGERTNRLVSFEMQKLMAAAVIVSPFLPMLFMGEERGEENPFLYFVSHSDKDLCEAVRKGRKEEFAAFHSHGEAPDPNAEETFLSSKLKWNLAGKGEHKVMLDYYKALISLRKNNPVFRYGDRKSISINYSEENKTLMLLRWHEQHRITCIMNFAKESRTIKLIKAAKWNKLLDSADGTWRGPGASTISIDAIQSQPESILILSKNN